MPRRFSKAHAALAFFALSIAGYALWVLASGHLPKALAASFKVRPWVFRLHLFGGAVALALSPFQFGAFAPSRRVNAHRVSGRIYTGAVLVAGTASLLLAPFAATGPIAQLGFGMLGAAWLGSTVLGVRAIHRGNVARHREWMVRSFALCCAGISLRLLLPLLMISTAGQWSVSYSIVAWLCWLPNLLLAERYLRSGRGALVQAVAAPPTSTCASAK
jgi:uncharacterized membrane protein